MGIVPMYFDESVYIRKAKKKKKEKKISVRMDVFTREN